MGNYFRYFAPRFRIAGLLPGTQAAILASNEFFDDASVVAESSGLADGSGSGSASVTAKANTQAAETGAAITAAAAQAIANTGGSSSGQSTTSAQVVGIGGSTWTKHPYTSMSVNVDGYWVYIPAGAGPQSSCIISFHGLGEQGDGGPTDLDKVITQGFAKLVNDRMNTGAEFPYDCICVFPQYIGTPLSGFFFQNVINYVKANFTFDESKLHITGYSNGAACVVNWWEVGTLTDVASCSITSTSLGYSGTAAPRVVAANMPCLFNHGTEDSGFTAYQKSVDWRDGLNALGINPQSVLDDMPGEGHNVDETVWDWTWYQPVPGKTQFEWHDQYSRVPATNTSGAASGASSTSANAQAKAAAQGQASAIADTGAAPKATANTSGSAAGSSTASIDIGSVTENTSGQADGTGSGSAGASARANASGSASGTGEGAAAAQASANASGSADGSSSASANAEAVVVVNTSGYADGVSVATVNAIAIVVTRQEIALSSKINSQVSRVSSITGIAVKSKVRLAKNSESEISSTLSISSRV